MKFQIQFISLAIIAIARIVVGRNYLMEKPDILKQCLLSDPQFNKCYVNNYQNVFSEWKDGVPGLKSVGSIDPLYVKRVSIAEDANSAVSLSVQLTNIKITGLSHAHVDDAGFKPDKMLTNLHVTVPKLILNADYTMKGRILTLPLNGSGKTTMVIENLKLITHIRHIRREENGLTFTDVDKVSVNIKDIGGFNIQLDNLFNGQKALEDSANALFNENWRDLFEALRPSITATYQSIMQDRLTKIFAYLPDSYYIGDLDSVN